MLIVLMMIMGMNVGRRNCVKGVKKGNVQDWSFVYVDVQGCSSIIQL